MSDGKIVMFNKKEETIISLEHVLKEYSSESVALSDVSLEIKKGEFVFVVGTSGSGKSTLIKLLLKEISPTDGSIIVNGKDINRLRHAQVAAYRRGIGCVFQDFRLLKDRNVYDNIAFAQKVIGVPNYNIKKNVFGMLAMIGLQDKVRAFPQELSGGEKQRVALARALVNNPKILLADEPTGNLDPRNSWEIMELLEEINKRGTTVLMVTHNKEIVNTMKKRVITLKKGILVSDEENGKYVGEKKNWNISLFNK